MADQEQDNESRSFHLEAGGVIFDKPKSEEEIARETRAREQHEFARSQVQTNKRLAWLTGLLVLGTFCGTLISLWQARISQKAANAAETAATTATQTLQEMKNGAGANDTHILAQQAVTQATQTTALATASKKQADQTERLANDALVQAKAANALATQAQRSADYAKQAIDTSVDADRPWIGVAAFSVDNHVEGHTAKARFTIENTGKRPASVTVKTNRSEFTSLPLVPFPSAGGGSVAFMLPGGSASTVFSYDVPERMVAIEKREHKQEFFYAEIIYTDAATSRAYITHYCALSDPTNADLMYPLCTRYNDAK